MARKGLSVIICVSLLLVKSILKYDSTAVHVI